MNKFYSEQLLNLADGILEISARTNFSENICCISYYEIISELIKALILESEGELDLVSAELIEDYLEEPGTEYVLTVDEFGIWVLPIEDFPSAIESTKLFVDNKALVNNKDILKFIDNEAEVYAFVLEEDKLTEEQSRLRYEFEEDNSEEITDVQNGDMHGFSFSKTQNNGTANYSFYSSDTDMVEKMRKELLAALDNE